MQITLLCTDPAHPVVARLRDWMTCSVPPGASVTLIHDKRDLSRGDLLFLVSCSQMISAAERDQYGAVLVLHASDLPRGRGWSPYIWAVLNGENRITVSLLEARDPVDSGAIWLKTEFTLEGHELLPEINARLFDAEIFLIEQAIRTYPNITPMAQAGDPGEYLRRRTPEDSRLDPHKTIAEQFDLLRVVDSQRFPAFFDYCGKRYRIRIEKDEDL